MDILSIESNYLKKWAAGGDVLKMRKLRPEDPSRAQPSGGCRTCAQAIWLLTTVLGGLKNQSQEGWPRSYQAVQRRQAYLPGCALPRWECCSIRELRRLGPSRGAPSRGQA